MSIAGGCRQLTYIGRLVRYSKLNAQYNTMEFCPCSKARICMLFGAKSVFLRTLSSASLEQSRKIGTKSQRGKKRQQPKPLKPLGLAARIVANAPHRIQPYMKLARVDKPIGK